MSDKDFMDNLKGIKISRLPKNTREEFISFAKEYYADDFGMALVELWNRYKEFMTIQGNIDLKLNYLISLSEENRKEDSSENEGNIKKISTFSDRINERRLT